MAKHSFQVTIFALRFNKLREIVRKAIELNEVGGEMQECLKLIWWYLFFPQHPHGQYKYI